MDKKDVPLTWIDAAMTGASPGCRDDARFYLANAYDTMHEDFLWGVLKEDPQVTCACGMSWDVMVSQGPDFGHDRYECPAAPDATLRIGKGDAVCELRIHGWTWNVHSNWPVGRTGCRSITGWLREPFDRTVDLNNGARLVYVNLPGGQVCPIGQKVRTEIKGYGDDRGLHLTVQWDDRSWD
jgi:hypothetical protein